MTDADRPTGPWHDPARSPRERAEALAAAMTPEEKLGQLVGVWVGASAEGGQVAPHQHEMNGGGVDLDALMPAGLGQLTRPFGTSPVDAGVGALSLARTQRRIADANRFGVPALAHEECLAGFAAWGATAYPVPVSCGATFDPDLVREMSARIGADLRRVGVHQGLAPVLDVVRDARWGRVEETIGEDPYLVGTVGAAYVAGLESAGVVATLKHFAGYSASRAGRNFGPVSMGPRERADVVLPPFETALRLGGARSVMHAYTDTDGVPSAADRALLTGLLRERWGFAGTVVADYFGVAFLHLLHGVAGGPGEAAALALAAGVDVELPTVDAFGAPLLERLRAGLVDEALVDRAVVRVLAQKAELGLLDADPDLVPAALGDAADADAVRGTVDLDPAGNRALAARIAERAVVLLSNDGVLPLAAPARIAVVGPNADRWSALLGCYSFPAHVGGQHPDVPLGIDLPTPLDGVRAEFPDAEIEAVEGTGVDDGATDGIAAAAEAARRADVALVVLGDRAGLFGRGTSGEGCDAVDLALPGAQQALLDAVLDTGTPTVVLLFTGRPYALGTAPARAAAIVQAFFPGEEGARAVAGVLSGRVNPSGRLPVSMPGSPGGQPSTYLAGRLAGASDVSNIDPTPAFPFGHGLGYAPFAWTGFAIDAAEAPVGSDLVVRTTVRNAGSVPGAEVVQLYLSDPVAQVVRPRRRLVGYARVELDPGASAEVVFTVPTDLAAYTGLSGRRRVDPGELVLAVGASSEDLRGQGSVVLTGDAEEFDDARDATRALVSTAEVTPR